MFLLSFTVNFAFQRWGMFCLTPPVLPVSKEKVEVEVEDNLSNRFQNYALDNQGNSNYGRVIFLRQFHAAVVGQNEERAKKIALYQNEILKELIKLNKKHVFVEGLTSNVFPESYLEPLIRVVPEFERYTNKQLWEGFFNLANGDKAYEHISKAYKSGITESVTEEQLKVLYTYHASAIYAFLHREAFLHKTTDEKDARALGMLALMSSMNQSENLAKQMNDFHEKLIRKELRSFFKDYRGEEVVLVLGAMHNIDDLVYRSFNPQIVSKLFLNSSAPVFLHTGPYEGSYNFFNPGFKDEK